MDKKDLGFANRQYETVRAFIDTLEVVETWFGNRFGITEKYSNPFHKGYELERFVEELGRGLIAFFVNRIREAECPNVEISPSTIQEMLKGKNGESKFDAVAIQEYIRKNFVAKSRELSINRILEEARHLLPTFWENQGRRDATVADILRGKQLHLRAYTHDLMELELHWDTSKYIAALEKIVKIVLDNENPVTVQSGGLSRLVSQDRKCFRFVMYVDRHMEGARFYKNGKMVLYMKSPEKARKVAEFLVKKDGEGQS